MKKIAYISIILAFTSFLIFFVFEGFQLKNMLFLPVLIVFFWVLIKYVAFIYQKPKNIWLRFSLIILDVLLIIGLFKLGFVVWKTQGGNILPTSNNQFQVNLSNIWFWVIFQSLIFVFLFNALKQLVTIDQK